MLLNFTRPGGVFEDRLARLSIVACVRSESPLLLLMFTLARGDDVAGIVGEAPLNACP